ncbi:MAG: hypothetical protein EA340_07830 [Nitriliruptor sp.]|nr:MAG: hypothetical protein EA340_07830 [Nitriliruptor sp.]TVR22094.1 MAG: hypothetical protein EA387_09210 [Nitriliruptor sp.]
MAASSETTTVGTYASQHDAEVARERLEGAGITPVTIETPSEDVWTVTAPESRKDDAIAELQIVEQRRRGPAV